MFATDTSYFNQKFKYSYYHPIMSHVYYHSILVECFALKLRCESEPESEIIKIHCLLFVYDLENKIFTHFLITEIIEQ